MTWEFLIANRELIVNGGDIISFLLVTPELTMYTAPRFAKFALVVGTILLIILFIGLGATLFFLVNEHMIGVGHDFVTNVVLVVFLIFFMLIPVSFVMGVLDIPIVQERVTRAISRYSLWFGVSVFLLAHTVGFITAAYDGK